VTYCLICPLLSELVHEKRDKTCTLPDLLEAFLTSGERERSVIAPGRDDCQKNRHVDTDTQVDQQAERVQEKYFES
jgi:hypothetical protein